MSATLVNIADLLRETEGPKLEESLEHAIEAYKNSQLADESPEDARRAIEQALELMPEPIGAPWLPFGMPAPVGCARSEGITAVYREKWRC